MVSLYCARHSSGDLRFRNVVLFLEQCLIFPFAKKANWDIYLEESITSRSIKHGDPGR